MSKAKTCGNCAHGYPIGNLIRCAFTLTNKRKTSTCGLWLKDINWKQKDKGEK